MMSDFKDSDFEDKIKTENVSVVQFSASWCMPCKNLIPIMNKFSDEYKDKANFYYAESCWLTNDTLTAFHLSSCSEASPIDPLVDLQLAQCNGASIELSAGSSVSNVIWNTGDTTNSIMVSQPGVYWFKANYPQGVVVLDSTTVPANLSNLTP